MRTGLIAIIAVFVIVLFVEFFYLANLSFFGAIDQKTGDLVLLATTVVFLVIYSIVWQLPRFKSQNVEEK